jgi:AmiR/NasT family two-component response regulator
MADYSAKRTATLKRITQLEADAKTIKPAKADRVKAKLAAARARLAAIDAKAATDGQPPKAKAVKSVRRAKK